MGSSFGPDPLLLNLAPECPPWEGCGGCGLSLSVSGTEAVAWQNQSAWSQEQKPCTNPVKNLFLELTPCFLRGAAKL